MTAPLWALGIDPGRHGAAALVLRRPVPLRPALVKTWAPVTLGVEELLQIARDARGIVGQMPTRAYIEIPAHGGANRGGKRTPATWLGLGRSIGHAEAACLSEGFSVEQIEGGEWCRRLGRGIPTGKQESPIGLPKGIHRLGEARTLIKDDGLLGPVRLEELLKLSGAEVERRIAVAEAALIAVAGLMPQRAANASRGKR